MKKHLKISLIFVLLVILSSCQKKPEVHKETFYGTFDTSIDYLSYAKSERDYKEEISLVKSEYQRLNDLYDNFNNHDGIVNVKSLNDMAGKGPVKVEDDLFNIIKFSKDNYEKTNGKLNIAMGNLIAVWTDARTYNTGGGDITGKMIDEKDMIIPNDKQLEEASKHMNIDDIVLDEANRTVEIKDPMLKIDLGAIGKGYATEIIANKLEEKGVKHASINAGGNVRNIGTPGDGRDKWGIGIQNPELGDSDFLEVFYIGESSVVTSGDYQRYFEKDGIRYHHIIDPDTHKPGGEFNSVTIVTKDSGLADYLSTSLFLSSKEEAEEILKNYEGVEVLWYSKEKGKTSTDGLRQYMKSEEDKSSK